VSIDFEGQELVAIADRSQDANMIACFVGDNKKDMHSITASGIIVRKSAEDLWRMTGADPVTAEASSEVTAAFAAATERWKACGDYNAFYAVVKDSRHPDFALFKDLRALGKKTNFTTEYGAQAPKLAETLVCERAEAQQYIDAKLAAFARAEEWKQEVIAKAHELGYSESLMGARRHLPELRSMNRFDVSRAERQAVNYEIQGSCAEQTRAAESRFWTTSLFQRYDARYIGPVHDECVSSCAVECLIPFLREKHALMVMPYGGMTVPIVGAISIGLNYGEQIEVGKFVDEAAIHEALRSLGFAVNMTTA